MSLLDGWMDEWAKQIKVTSIIAIKVVLLGKDLISFDVIWLTQEGRCKAKPPMAEMRDLGLLGTEHYGLSVVGQSVGRGSLEWRITVIAVEHFSFGYRQFFLALGVCSVMGISWLEVECVGSMSFWRAGAMGHLHHWVLRWSCTLHCPLFCGL
jgi:hypothetical protein